jgi:glucose-6-phosphate isomerase
VARHFVALSTNAAAVAEFGIAPDSSFGFWDWVGGRYSMLSAIGLSTMIAIGPERFDELRAGARAMDEHFRDAPPASNLPLLHGLLGVWNSNFLGAGTLAVLPYEQHLRRFPAYLQQLVMESNGKRVSADGRPLDCETAPIVWGEPGTNGQHSFHQLLHQGTRRVACDFIVAARSAAKLPGHHALLVANALAQSEALAFGLTEDELRAAGSPEALLPHRACPGNRPSSTLLIDELTPAALGALVALYEHSTYVQSVIWGIDAFDQWGVELGKRLANRLAPALQGEADLAAFDSSTRTLVERLRRRADPV